MDCNEGIAPAGAAGGGCIIFVSRIFLCLQMIRRPNKVESGTIVIFGGSFDPITITHIQVAAEVIHFELADQVWVVPCGMRPDKRTNIEPRHRLEMVSMAIDSMLPHDFPMFVDSTEVDAGRYVPTRELMCLYRQRYPGLRFKVLIGNDLLSSLHLWDDFTSLISENKFIVYKRIFTSKLGLEPDSEDYVCLNDEGKTRIQVEQISGVGMTPTLSNISSTEIRKRMVTKGIHAIAGLTPLCVINYITDNKLYFLPPQTPE